MSAETGLSEGAVLADNVVTHMVASGRLGRSRNEKRVNSG